MSKPRGMIAIMFGHPSPMAHEDESERDRGKDNSELEHFDDGPGEPDILRMLYLCLRNGDQEAAQAATRIAHCLQRMAQLGIHGDKPGLTVWFERCRHLLIDVEERACDHDGE